ncbi:hypothetical protein [Saccharothrix xinjiangensis]|uniref:Uncharacterized protein n=1 Tax=Saccharothrix xinjiangensis TaxID=204798 RepID=A0ABV9XXI5_9PSEU
MELTTLPTPRGADCFDFLTKDHGVIAEVIREGTKAAESRFLGHLHD